MPKAWMPHIKDELPCMSTTAKVQHFLACLNVHSCPSAPRTSSQQPASVHRAMRVGILRVCPDQAVMLRGSPEQGSMLHALTLLFHG